MDYIAYDSRHQLRLGAGGNTGAVDVVDAGTE